MLRQRIPILRWLPEYDRKLLRGDLAAGIAVTALIVPKNLGYAEIAGVPVQNGLYAAAAGALLYAIFGTSRQVSTGPSSSLAAVAGGAVLVTQLSGNAAAQLVAAIAVMTGILFLAVAVFKLGWIARFMSKAVVTGFLAGAAIDVIIGELPKITGTSAEGDNAWRELISWFGSIDESDLTTLAVGIAGLALILGLRRFAPRTPGALVVVVFGLVASAVFDLGAHGVALVGDVPSGLPTPELPDWSLLTDHAATIVVASLALLLIGFSQTIGDARVFATRHGYRIDTDQESVAQGMANIGAGVLQGMPVSTSLSASSLNESSGAKSGVASLATGGFVVLTLLFLAPLFSDLPKAILAAVVIDAVAFGMIDVHELRRLKRVARVDFAIAVAAATGALLSGVLFGVIIGILLSLAWLIYVATSPSIPLLGRKPDSQVFREHGEFPEDELDPSIAVLRLDAGLFFATTEALDDRVRELVPAEKGELSALVLDLEGANFIDSQGSEKLSELDQLCAQRGAELHLARVQPDVLKVLALDDTSDWVGSHRVHGNVYEAVEAAASRKQ
jgi:high affinity sulfate transporter 1